MLEKDINREYDQIIKKRTICRFSSSKKGRKVSVIKPIKGNKREMLDLCIKNSEISLKNKIIKGTKIQSQNKSIKNLTNIRDNFLIDLQKLLKKYKI